MSVTHERIRSGRSAAAGPARLGLPPSTTRRGATEVLRFLLDLTPWRWRHTVRTLAPPTGNVPRTPRPRLTGAKRNRRPPKASVRAAVGADDRGAGRPHTSPDAPHHTYQGARHRVGRVLERLETAERAGAPGRARRTVHPANDRRAAPVSRPSVRQCRACPQSRSRDARRAMCRRPSPAPTAPRDPPIEEFRDVRPA